MIKTNIKLGFLIIVFLIQGSCTSHKKLIYLENLDTTTVQQFHPKDKPDYKIQYQDILYININTLNPELNNMLNPGYDRGYYTYRDESTMYVFGYTVSDSGTVSLPILGDIYVYGLTINEIHDTIKKRASNYLKDATINVKLLSYKFTVIGEVNRPGTYKNYNNQLTVLEAIGMAGDITDYGNRKQVLVVRPAQTGTYTYRINVQDKNLLQSEGYFLLPNDIVIVEPIRSKPFQLNIPTMALVLTTISTLILVLSFISPK